MRQRLRRIAPTALVVVGIAVGSAYWVWSDGALARTIAALPTSERARLYTRTLENLRLCHARAQEDALRDFCDEQATLALAFPQCEDECSELARLPWTGTRR